MKYSIDIIFTTTGVCKKSHWISNLCFFTHQQTTKALLKTWTDLYQAFSRCAAMVTTAEDNQCCQDLCTKICSFVIDGHLTMVCKKCFPFAHLGLIFPFFWNFFRFDVACWFCFLLFWCSMIPFQNLPFMEVVFHLCKVMVDSVDYSSYTNQNTGMQCE